MKFSGVSRGKAKYGGNAFTMHYAVYQVNQPKNKKHSFSAPSISELYYVITSEVSPVLINFMLGNDKGALNKSIYVNELPRQRRVQQGVSEKCTPGPGFNKKVLGNVQYEYIIRP